MKCSLKIEKLKYNPILPEFEGDEWMSATMVYLWQKFSALTVEKYEKKR